MDGRVKNQNFLGNKNVMQSEPSIFNIFFRLRSAAQSSVSLCFLNLKGICFERF